MGILLLGAQTQLVPLVVSPHTSLAEYTQNTSDAEVKKMSSALHDIRLQPSTPEHAFPSFPCLSSRSNLLHPTENPSRIRKVEDLRFQRTDTFLSILFYSTRTAKHFHP